MKLIILDREITDRQCGDSQPRGRVDGYVIWLSSVRIDVNITHGQFVKHKMVYYFSVAVMVKLHAQYYARLSYRIIPHSKYPRQQTVDSFFDSGTPFKLSVNACF